MLQLGKKAIDKSQVIVSGAVNHCYETIMRRRLKNHDFTILCSNCAGGIICHRLGLPFRSPTVNLWLHQRDFLKLAANLKEYMSCDLEFVDSKEYDHPVARLKDITIYFNHSKSEQEAETDWNRRKARINYENLFLLMYDREGMTLEELRKIEQIPCRGKIVFSDRKHPELDYVVTMKPTDRPNGAQCLDPDWLGLRTFERHFDYVKWLNG